MVIDIFLHSVLSYSRLFTGRENNQSFFPVCAPTKRGLGDYITLAPLILRLKKKS